jgi:hypothetical protein
MLPIEDGKLWEIVADLEHAGSAAVISIWSSRSRKCVTKNWELGHYAATTYFIYLKGLVQSIATENRLHKYCFHSLMIMLSYAVI